MGNKVTFVLVWLYMTKVLCHIFCTLEAQCNYEIAEQERT